MSNKASSLIPGVVIHRLAVHSDSRGWLAEVFRNDELPSRFQPAMGYVSVTLPGIARGPHEHRDQTDAFAFLSGQMKLVLWENRPNKPSCREEFIVGIDNPVLVLVPPGVVHAYVNTGNTDAQVLNFPDRLYRGNGKKEEVDEIRHEDDPDARFKL